MTEDSLRGALPLGKAVKVFRPHDAAANIRSVSFAPEKNWGVATATAKEFNLWEGSTGHSLGSVNDVFSRAGRLSADQY